MKFWERRGEERGRGAGSKYFFLCVWVRALSGLCRNFAWSPAARSMMENGVESKVS